MDNADQYQARLSALVKPREGPCLNVMDAAAHTLQEQHRRRFDRRLMSGLAQTMAGQPQPSGETPLQRSLRKTATFGALYGSATALASLCRPASKAPNGS